VRIWSIHPRYLDPQGLTACWRESLLAQAVLAGRTRGYTRHPQLARFSATAVPLDAIGAYLAALAAEADARGYRFDRTRIDRPRGVVAPIAVSDGQLALEWRLLTAKLAHRSPAVAARWADVASPETHPLFHLVPGPRAEWERAAG
jgi:hypothetical protein